MVKSDRIDLRYKIRDTCDILRTENPTVVATAILEGLNPPDISYKNMRLRVARLLAKKVDGQWVLEDHPKPGRPVSVLTPKGLGRLKKMRKKSVRKIESYTMGSAASTISKSSAYRGKQQNRLTWFKYHCFLKTFITVRQWTTTVLNKRYHIPWRAAHSLYIVNSWGVREWEDARGTRLGSYQDAFGDTRWERLVDVDWSSNYGLYGYSNSQNDGYWAETRAQFYTENYKYVRLLLSTLSF